MSAMSACARFCTRVHIVVEVLMRMPPEDIRGEMLRSGRREGCEQGRVAPNGEEMNVEMVMVDG